MSLEDRRGTERIAAKGVVRGGLSGAFICLLVALWMVIELPQAFERSIFAVGATFATAGMALTATWFLFRYSRTGCRIQPSGLLIKNVFSERTIPWARIDHFDEGPAWGFYANFLRVHTTDGKVVPVTGVQQRIESEWMQDVIDRLEAARLSHSAEGP
jgi:hypothetical protein